jgi:hypothetical protein
MHNPLPKITAVGQVGIGLLTYAVDKLDPQPLPPPLLYGLSVLGVMLILWESITLSAHLVRHIRSRSNKAH